MTLATAPATLRTSSPTPNRPAPVRLDSLTQAQAAVVRSLLRAQAAAHAAAQAQTGRPV
jgi:hypothetical protein